MIVLGFFSEVTPHSLRSYLVPMKETFQSIFITDAKRSHAQHLSNVVKVYFDFSDDHCHFSSYLLFMKMASTVGGTALLAAQITNYR